MSIKVMSAVWELDLPPGEKLVLLALADFANDAGECWPSMEGIARKSSMTERGVRKIVRKLEDAGLVQTNVGGGRFGCSVYYLKPGTSFPPEHRSPRNVSAETRNVSAQNPEPRSPEPSRTIKEPSYTPLPPKGGYDEGFEAFWEIYPRKVGKGQAAKAFARKVKQFGIDAVMDGLRRHLPGLNAQNKGPGQDYRPHPATWLNGDRFNDPVAGYTPSLLERMANGANDLGSTGALDWRGTGYLPAPIRNTQPSD